MSERWARPARILDIEEEPTMIVQAKDGRRFGVPRITVDEDTSERIRLGYMCALCFQAFPEPYPETCSFCGARVRDGQGRFFERMYQGREQLPGGFEGEENFDAYAAIAAELRRQGQ